MSTTKTQLVSFAGRMLAVVALTIAGGALLQAQTAQDGSTASAATVAAAQSASEQAPKLNLQIPASDLTADSVSSSSSSSSSSSDLSDTEIAANTTEPFRFMNAMQYGGGSNGRYGRPRYRGGNTNADGSPKYDFYVGGGFGLPIGTQSNYLTTGWGMQFGGGRMFNKNVGVNLEFDYDHFGMTNATIENQSQLYFQDTAADTGLDANSHVWSLGVQPIFNIRSGEGMGAYITGGAGYYHKVANFTIPEEEEYCDPYYGICEPIEVNGVIDHYSSNAAGFNGGFGVTYKFSKFASERLYGEVRYVYMANQYRPANYIVGGSNFFPQNSQHTSYIPVKLGLRF
jgi:hypothetical protein